MRGKCSASYKTDIILRQGKNVVFLSSSTKNKIIFAFVKSFVLKCFWRNTVSFRNDECIETAESLPLKHPVAFTKHKNLQVALKGNFLLVN